MIRAHLCLTLLALASCAGWAATREAGLRRMGAARMEICIRNNPCYFKSACVQQARAFCVDAGIEPGCAFGEPEGMACGSSNLSIKPPTNKGL